VGFGAERVGIWLPGDEVGRGLSCRWEPLQIDQSIPASVVVEVRNSNHGLTLSIPPPLPT